MHKLRDVLIAGALGAAALTGCAGPTATIRGGNANSVEINYAGDVARTLPLARQYCARYERVPRLADPGLDIAIYDCVQP